MSAFRYLVLHAFYRCFDWSVMFIDSMEFASMMNRGYGVDRSPRMALEPDPEVESRVPYTGLHAKTPAL